MNRIVTELAEERARPGRRQRRLRRWPLRGARVRTCSLVRRPNVRREGAPNGSRGGCAPWSSFQTAAQFGRIPFAVPDSKPFDLGLGNDFEGHFLAKRRFLISADTASAGV